MRLSSRSTTANRHLFAGLLRVEPPPALQKEAGDIVPVSSVSGESREKKTANYRTPLIVLSIVIIAVVFALLMLPGYGENVDLGFDVKILPLMNAIFNGIAFVFLVAAYVAIRQKRLETHKRLMLCAVAVSTLFLISYVTYHTLAPSTPYGGEGVLRYVYFFFLLSHIVLAVAVVPLALFTLFSGLSKEFRRHRRIAKWALPVWMYVSITGVIVYLMIRPYY